MKGSTAHQLDVEVPESQCSLRGLPNRRKCFGEQVIEGFAGGIARAKFFSFLFQLIVTEVCEGIFELVDGFA